MIESLALHGVQSMDLAPALMTTHTVANPEYDPEEARKHKEDLPHIREGKEVEEEEEHAGTQTNDTTDAQSISGKTLVDESPSDGVGRKHSKKPSFQTTARVLAETTKTVPGITTTLSSADKDVTLDIRWTVLCDLFLVLVADSVYDARSRVLLENVAIKLGLGWTDVTKFECRVTEALEIQESVETLEHEELVLEHQKKQKKKRYMMLGLATIGQYVQYHGVYLYVTYIFPQVVVWLLDCPPVCLLLSLERVWVLLSQRSVSRARLVS